MPYKISGTKSETARIIILKESDWSIESNTVVSGSGAYSVEELESGVKTVITESTSGEMLGYGDVSPEYYIIPARGVFAGGRETGDPYNIIEYITITTPGNASDFGDLTLARYVLVATSNGASDRGVFAGGQVSASYYNIMDYITISTTGDATDFGDLLEPMGGHNVCSNGINDRGLFSGGSTSKNVLVYITISSTGNATDFGNMSYEVYFHTSFSNGTNNRGIIAGGDTDEGGGAGGRSNTISYVTISTPGNSTDFGDLNNTLMYLAATSNGTNNRGVVSGGSYNVNYYQSVNVIDYITITSTGNATDFGDLPVAKRDHTSTSNMTNNRGVFAGGYDAVGPNHLNNIEYITISSLGNATDFGDLTVARYGLSATSNA